MGKMVGVFFFSPNLWPGAMIFFNWFYFNPRGKKQLLQLFCFCFCYSTFQNYSNPQYNS